MPHSDSFETNLKNDPQNISNIYYDNVNRIQSVASGKNQQREGNLFNLILNI